jgi:protein SCO1/2
MNKTRWGYVALLIAVAVAGAAAGWLAQTRWIGQPPRQVADEGRVLIHDLAIVVRERPKVLAPFDLTTVGAHVGLPSLVGHWTLLFFGYTSCPDVCPSSLATLAQVVDHLQGKWPVEPLRVVMVSVDPDRDTPQRLQDYVSHFHAGFVGATGTRREIDDLTAQFRARYKIHKEEGEHYSVDHTAAVFIIDPDGRYVGFLSQPLEVDPIVKRLLLVRALYDQHMFK